MNLKAYLFDDNRGVSPVIGVILMVAITVILAAVIATFVMNMGPTETTMPSASFDWDNGSYTDSSTSTTYHWIEVTHDGGEAIDKSNLELSVDWDTGSDTFDSLSGEITASGSINQTDGGDGSSPTGPPLSAELIWTNPDSDETQVLTDWEA